MTATGIEGLPLPVLVGELMENVALFPDHLEVTIAEVFKLNVTLQEVGLRETVSSRGVGRTIGASL